MTPEKEVDRYRSQTYQERDPPPVGQNDPYIIYCNPAGIIRAWLIRIILPAGNKIQQGSEKAGLLIQPFVPFNLSPCHQDPDLVFKVHTTVNANGCG